MTDLQGVLPEVAEGVYSVTRPIKFYGVECGSRMTVVRLSDGGVFVHSPVVLDPRLEEAVRALGPVRAIAAPSLFHHLSVNAWRERFPEASVHCCPALARKRPDVPWTSVLGDSPEAAWKGDLEQVHFSSRTMEDEVVFCHPASRTLICADAVFNLSTHPSMVTRAVAWVLGNHRPGATYLEHIMMRKRALARSQVDRMLAWDPVRLLIAHGQPVMSDGRRVLAEAYAWL